MIFLGIVVCLTASLQLSWFAALGTGSLPCSERASVLEGAGSWILRGIFVHLLGSYVGMTGDTGEIAVDHFSNTRFE